MLFCMLVCAQSGNKAESHAFSCAHSALFIDLTVTLLKASNGIVRSSNGFVESKNVCVTTAHTHRCSLIHYATYSKCKHTVRNKRQR